MLVEQLVHQVAQLDVVLTVRLGHFAQAMLRQDQLPRRRVLVVDLQHAHFHQPRQVPPTVQGLWVDWRLQAGAEGAVYVGGEGFEQRRDAGKEVIHGRRRDLRPLRHAVDRKAGHTLAGQQSAGRVEDRVDPRLATGAGFARGGTAAHISC